MIGTTSLVFMEAVFVIPNDKIDRFLELKGMIEIAKEAEDTLTWCNAIAKMYLEFDQYVDEDQTDVLTH